jgi:transposase
VLHGLVGRDVHEQGSTWTSSPGLVGFRPFGKRRACRSLPVSRKRRPPGLRRSVGTGVTRPRSMRLLRMRPIVEGRGLDPLAGEQDDALGLAPHRVVVPDALDGLHQLARPGSWTYSMRPAALRLGVLGPAVQGRATRPDDGPINGETFRLYVDTVLVPTLRQGDIVVMDNLGSHKSKAVRRAIRAAGARLLFLPKYSPDLNPIEQLFSKLKHWLRKAAGRTADAVCNALGPILDTVTPAECSRYFGYAGYRQT